MILHSALRIERITPRKHRLRISFISQLHKRLRLGVIRRPPKLLFQRTCRVLRERDPSGLIVLRRPPLQARIRAQQITRPENHRNITCNLISKNH